MHFSAFFFVGLFCSLFLPEISYSAHLKHAGAFVPRVLDDKAVATVWKRVAPSKERVTSPTKATGPRSGSGGSGPLVAAEGGSSIGETRQFIARLEGQDRWFEVDRKGQARTATLESKDAWHDVESVIRLNLDSPELRETRQQLAHSFAKSSKSAPPPPPPSLPKPPSRKKNSSPRKPPKASPRAGASTVRGSADGSGSPVLGVRPVASRRVKETKPRSAAAAAVADDEVTPSILAVPDGLMDTIHHMLNAPENAVLAQAATPLRGSLKRHHELVRPKIKKAYDTILKLGDEKPGAEADAAAWLHYRKELEQHAEKIVALVRSSPAHYGMMNRSEREALAYAANYLQLKSDAQGALKLLNEKGLELSKLRELPLGHGELLLDASFRAGKHIEVARAFSEGVSSEYLDRFVMSVPGRLQSGSRRPNRYMEKMWDTFDDDPPSQEVANRWLEMLALGRKEISGNLPESEAPLGFPSLFERTEAIAGFLRDQTIPPKSKMMLGIFLNGTAGVSLANRRMALYHVFQVPRNTPEFREAAALLLRDTGRDPRVIELAYDALYGVPLTEAQRKEWLKQASLPVLRAPEAVAADGGTDEVLVHLESFVEAAEASAVAASGGGSAPSSKLQILRNLRLAEQALSRSDTDGVLLHVQQVLDKAKPEELLPGATQRLHELKVLAAALKAQRTALESTAELNKAFQIASDAFTAANVAKVKIPLDTQIEWFRARAQWQVSQGKENQAVLSLWEASRLGWLRKFSERKVQASEMTKAPEDSIAKLFDEARSSRLDVKHRKYLNELRRYDKSPTKVSRLDDVPEGYRPEIIYFTAEVRIRLIGHPAGKKAFVRDAERVLGMSPHPILRDYIYLAAGGMFPEVNAQKGIAYLERAAKSQHLSETSNAVARAASAALRLEHTKLSKKQMAEAQNEILRFAPKAGPQYAAPLAYILTMPKYVELGGSMNPGARESLLGAYNHSIWLYEHHRKSVASRKIVAQLRQGRAKLIDSILSEELAPEILKVSDVSEHLGIDGNTLLSRLAASDKKFIRDYERSVREAAEAR